MPLSPAAPREPIHTRNVTCRGFRRKDRLWDIEGHLTDINSYGFETAHRGHVASGTPVHDMWIRLTIDDDFVVHDVEAVTDGSPYPICPTITINFKRLKGLTIGPGSCKNVYARVGGVQGCTHLVELLGPIATTAYQTAVSARSPERSGSLRNGEGPTPTSKASAERPRLLNACHAFGETSPVVKNYWPEFHKQS